MWLISCSGTMMRLDMALRNNGHFKYLLKLIVNGIKMNVLNFIMVCPLIINEYWFLIWIMGSSPNLISQLIDLLSLRSIYGIYIDIFYSGLIENDSWGIYWRMYLSSFSREQVWRRSKEFWSHKLVRNLLTASHYPEWTASGEHRQDTSLRLSVSLRA